LSFSTGSCARYQCAIKKSTPSWSGENGAESRAGFLT
jgi:hypothetical protein